MKNHNEKRFVICALIGVLGMMLVCGVAAQNFKTLHSVTADSGLSPYLTNSDGVSANELNLSGNTLYGTADIGGASGTGTIFKLNADGTDFNTVYNFLPEDETTNSFSFPTNFEGANPVAGLILSSNMFYGTALLGGNSGVGTVFKVKTDGTGFTNLHDFTTPTGADLYFEGTNSDGGNPGGLILSGNTLYGTASEFGSLDNGVVFAIKTDSTGFTNLHNFAGYPSDGANPVGGLILSENVLYGTTVNGGVSSNGMLFAINTDGTIFTNLHDFSLSGLNASGDYTNSDGAYPQAGLIISGGTLFGTAKFGGCSGNGVVFKVGINGMGFTNLHSFSATSGSYPAFVNADGANPYAGLVLLGNTLYGTTYCGGSSGNGTIFAIDTNGTGFTNIHNFSALDPNNCNSDGANPPTRLILSGETLYGTTQDGGGSGNGTIFSLSFAPQLAITASGTNVILTWPMNVAGFDYSGFTLQSTTNLVSTNWSAVSPSPVVVNGQNTVTNAISGAQMFYRLSH